MENNRTYIKNKRPLAVGLYMALAFCFMLLCAACTNEAVEPTESALYKHYASRPELSVAQVCGFRLCDTVRTDVVLLRAESDEAWQQLAEEFNLDGQEGVESWLGDTNQPALRVKWTGEPVVRAIASHPRRTLAFYRLENETQYDALIDYQLGEMKTEK